jgi:hypothetical protein
MAASTKASTGGEAVPNAAVSKCTTGLMSRLEPTLKHVDARLKAVNERQADLAEKVEAENDKFSKSEEQFQIEEMIAKTKAYLEKLVSLQKEMGAAGERAAAMRARAMKMQEAKQKEALKREQKRQKDAERDEQLVAKPAQKK